MSRRLRRIRGASLYCTEAMALFAAFTTRPTSQRKQLYDKIIRQLKVSGIWGALDCFYIFAAADSQAALINIKNPGTFNATAQNGPTFAADRGYTGNGSNSYVDSNFNASTAGGNYVRDSAHMAVWSLTTVTPTNQAIGFQDTGFQAVMYPKNGAGDGHYLRLNVAATGIEGQSVTD